MILQNISYLTGLKIVELALPLFTYPYLIRTLGFEIYGTVIFCTALVSYITVLVSFGFEISEIKDISIHRNDPFKVSEIVSAVILIRLTVAVIVSFALVITVVSIFTSYQHRLLYLFSIGIIFNVALSPQFYFLGVEKMKNISMLTIASNIIYVFLVFLFVKTPSQFWLIPLFMSLSGLTSSSIGFYIMTRKDLVRLIFPKIKTCKMIIANSSPFFLSRLSVLAVSRTNIILLGSFIGYGEVALYDLADKLVTVMKMPYGIINQVLFPNVSKSKNIKLVIKILKHLVIIYILGYTLILFLGEDIISIIGGNDLIPAKSILNILGIGALTELISVFLGAPLLLVMGYNKIYNGSIIYGSLFYMVLIIITYTLGIINSHTLAIVSVTTSAYVLLYRYRYCVKYGLV